MGFGTVEWIADPTIFIIFSLFWRMIGGIGGACLHTTTYAIVSLKYPDDIETNIGLLEAASGLGFFVGPLVGSIVYDLTAYWCPFFLFAGTLLIAVLFFKRVLTPDLDHDPQKEAR